MKISRFIKREDRSTNFGSKSWGIEITPSDLGLPEPKTLADAQRCAELLAAFGQVFVCGEMVKEGQMSQEEFNQMAAPYAALITQHK